MKVTLSPTILNSSKIKTFENLSKASLERYENIINSAQSKTLQELYTDEFRPKNLHSGVTTVKSIRSGKPQKAFIDTEREVSINDYVESTKFTHNLTLQNGDFLGYKYYTFNKYPNGTKKYDSGKIESFQNNKYAGAQIRLLQASLEHAHKEKINDISLIALYPALKFHTMMGFRPIESKVDLRSLKDIKQINEETEFLYYNLPLGYKKQDIIPVIVKKDDEFFYDRNKTLFCTVMEHNNKVLEKKHQKHLPLEKLNQAIDMYLPKEEFEKWLERIKGFEILPE